MIAGKEMVRAKVRFGLLIGAIALLAFLILFQQAPRDGLIAILALATFLLAGEKLR